MTYAANEVTRQSAKPVELYRFTVAPAAVSDIYPPDTAPPGQLIVPNALSIGTWTTVRDEAQTTLSPTYPPSSPDSYVLHAGNYAEIWGAYHGPIGGGNAAIYLHGEIPAVDSGLEPSTVYVARVLSIKTDYSLGSYGTRIPAPYGDGNGFGDISETFNDLGDIDGEPGWGPTPTWQSRTFTTDVTGAFHIDCGFFNSLQVGAAEICFLWSVAVYNPDGQPENPGESSDLLTFPETAINLTSADETFVYQGETYVPDLILRDHFRLGSDGLAKAELDAAFERTSPIAPYVNTQHLTPSPIGVEVYRGHRDDIVAGTLTSAATLMVGHVLKADFEAERIVLSFAPTERYVARRIPRTLIQPQCNNFLYDTVCGVDPFAFSTTGTVTAIENQGLWVTIGGLETFAAGDLTYFQFGVVIGTTGRRSFIAAQNGDVLTLWKADPDLAVGSAVRVLAGCDRSTAVCKNRFNNLAQRRGFDLIPIRNPFTGGGLG
jgi:hypothetical protein